MQELRFLGAAGTVTGSKFVLGTPGGKVLVDCGMYQGDREQRQRNWASFPVPAQEIDAVVLTHAHLDHCGWLPRLVRRGYAGPVHCSPWTAQVAAIVLRDAAHLQEEDAEYAATRGYSKHHPPLPLFDTADAEKAISLFRDLEHGASTSLKMFGGYVPVRAEVVGITEFSAHADSNDLLAWLRTAPKPPRACYVVHGEPEAGKALAHRIHTELDWCAAVPAYAERVLI